MTSTSSTPPLGSKASSGIGGSVGKAFTWLSGIGSLVVSGALVVYAVHNHSGHTGFEPWVLSIVFVPSLIIGLSALLSRGPRTAGIVACVAGFGGMALLFYLDIFNVLLEYDRWLQRGMP